MLYHTIFDLTPQSVMQRIQGKYNLPERQIDAGF